MKSQQRLPHSMSRRTFGALAATTTASLASRAVAVEEGEKSPGWIDAHVHVWSSDTQRYPLAEQFEPSAMDPPSFTPTELLQHCRPAGVERIVLIQMSFYEYDHRYMFEAMQAHPGVFSAVALIDFHAADVTEQMVKLARKGVRGFRLHSRGDAKNWPGIPSMRRLWQRAGEEGLAVCPLINPEDLPHVDALCQAFPDTTVVVDHFARLGISGKVDPASLDQLCRLARFPNVHVKTSAFYALGKKSPPYVDLIAMIRRVVDAFGVERLMWASDCPFQVQGEHTYEASIALIRDRVEFLSDSDKQWMLKGTANRVFFA
jgi:predicted TIM-barrel fold metal-dependent hydrolase